MFVAVWTSVVKKTLKKLFFETWIFLKSRPLLFKNTWCEYKTGFCSSRMSFTMSVKFALKLQLPGHIEEVLQMMQDWFIFWLNLLNFLSATFSRTENEWIKPLYFTLYSQYEINKQAVSFFMHEIQMDTQNLSFEFCVNVLKEINIHYYCLDNM